MIDHELEEPNSRFIEVEVCTSMNERRKRERK
jgi:hypothetical protein